MADNEQNKQTNNEDKTSANPMKTVATSPLPVKHEFRSDDSYKNSKDD